MDTAYTEPSCQTFWNTLMWEAEWNVERWQGKIKDGEYLTLREKKGEARREAKTKTTGVWGYSSIQQLGRIWCLGGTLRENKFLFLRQS